MRWKGLTWFHRHCLASPGFTWLHLASLDLFWLHLHLLSTTWYHLASFDRVSIGLTWSHMASLGFTWHHYRKGRGPKSQGKRERAFTPCGPRFLPQLQSARSRRRMKRNDFTVDLTPPASDLIWLSSNEVALSQTILSKKNTPAHTQAPAGTMTHLPTTNWACAGSGSMID